MWCKTYGIIFMHGCDVCSCKIKETGFSLLGHTIEECFMFTWCATGYISHNFILKEVLCEYANGTRLEFKGTGKAVSRCG